jgi:hypothetical protein
MILFVVVGGFIAWIVYLLCQGKDPHDPLYCTNPNCPHKHYNR